MPSGAIATYAAAIAYNTANQANSLVERDSDGSVNVGQANVTVLNSSAGAILPVVAKTGDYTATVNDSTITMSGAHTLTLPAAAAMAGKVLCIKKIDNTTSLVVDGNASETLDNAATKTSTEQWSALIIQSDGTNWIILASMGTWT